jgi:hypothetical protein
VWGRSDDRRHAGRRASVISYLKVYGGDLERVHREALEHVSLEQLRVAVAWYDEHSEEIDALLRERQALYERRVTEAVAA